MTDKQLDLYNKEDKSNGLSENALRTKKALDKILADKMHKDKVTTLSTSTDKDDTTYIRYTSAQFTNLSGDKKAPKQRIIKIRDEEVDPLLPSSFRIRKVPDGPPKDGFAPVLHDETSTQKLTKEDQKKWEIAPSVSNWKNTKGFIIGIENRLHNSQSANQITDEDIEKSTKRFVALSDALKNAEKQAKEDLKARASWRKRKEEEKITQIQERVGKLAQEARLSRTAADDKPDVRVDSTKITENSGNPSRTEISDKQQRRAERRRRAEEELRKEKLSTKDKVRKLAREQGREVSDRVVLGVANAIRTKQNQGVYDTDLYLKSSSKSKESTDLMYDKPLFSHETALNDVYRTRNLSGYKGLGSKSGGQSESNSTSVTFVRDPEDDKKNFDNGEDEKE